MPSFFKLFLPAGLLFLACAAGLDHSSFLEKVSLQRENWKEEAVAIQNAGYLVRLSGESGLATLEGTLEIYYLKPDTLIFFSPGFLGKGSLRGRWHLGDSLLAYFPREKMYDKGGWARFLLAHEEGEIKGLDSLFFGILSLQAMLVNPQNDSRSAHSQNGRGWVIKDSLGRWQREHIFNRRGKRSMVRWYSNNPELEVMCEMEKGQSAGLLPRKIELTYPSEKIEAKLDIKEIALNTIIPSSKINFAIPADAIPYEER